VIAEGNHKRSEVIAEGNHKRSEVIAKAITTQ
jgi:hypothetical protein